MATTTTRTRARAQPRPILKRDSYPAPLADDSELPFTMCDYIISPRVHFPPTPNIASLSFTHSPNTYDRAPIVISPNSGCLQLPKRGERRLYSPSADFDGERRGRTRSRCASRERDSPSPDVKGSYFHPRAFEACSPEPLDSPATPLNFSSSPPDLIRDVSPSEEEDDLVGTPPDSRASAMIEAAHADAKCGVSPNRADHSPRSSRRRPAGGLLRRSVVTVSFATPDLDEGCLGGF
ncbi:hypothetical protein C8Q72DRAFT_148546 [Fomitopsis betulina]|nr:hypothetical protein C8Q72DRAFT_148546 [Fomitopsis betulina]